MQLIPRPTKRTNLCFQLRGERHFRDHFRGGGGGGTAGIPGADRPGGRLAGKLLLDSLQARAPEREKRRGW
jgi:hypothetical protein